MDEKELNRISEEMKVKSDARKKHCLTVPQAWPPKERTVKQWIAHGLECAVVKSDFALCGYVKVPAGHPDDGQWHDDVEAHIHGGLTFCCRAEGGGSWFGFDCGHAGDWISFSRPGHHYEHPGTIWTVEDVANECESLASQLSRHTD